MQLPSPYCESGAERRVAEDEMVGWQHQLNGDEFEQALGDSKEQGSLAYAAVHGLQRVGHDLKTEQQRQA